MASVRKVPSPSSPLIVISGDVARSLDPKVLYPNDEGSTRMGDEGCPNEGQRLENAIGYSREEKEDNSIGREEAL
jgi:hypothetical protein